MNTLFLIIGPLGSGKTTIAKHLFQKISGAKIVEVDHLAHTLYQTKEVKRGIFKIFGASLFCTNGEIDRKKMLHLLIKYPQKWYALEAFIHPLMKDLLWEEISSSPPKETLLIPCALPSIFAPVIFSSQKKVKIIYCTGKREELYQRLKKSRGMPQKVFCTLWNRQNSSFFSV